MPTGASGAGWTNPANIEGLDGVYATFHAGGPSGELHGTNFGFTVPAGATIVGIAVVWTRHGTNGFGGVNDSEVRILKGGSTGTQNKAAGGAWPTSDGDATYGGQSDLWGDTWTPADVNDTGFGASMKVTGTNDTASVDAVKITVYYTAPFGIDDEECLQVKTVTNW